MSLLEMALGNRRIKELALGSANWLDLQLSWRTRLLKEVAPLAKGRLLDVGCGKKPDAHIFAPYVTEYVGVEHEAAFDLTTSSRAQAGPDVLFDGVRLPFVDASFDTVLNLDVLEHTPEPARLMREIGRVLRPGGVLILTAPFSFRLHELPHDYFRYSPGGLAFLCQQAGIEVQKTSSLGSLLTVVAHKLNSYLMLEVAHLDGVGQALGKLGHESERNRPPRYWTLPWVLPAMFANTAIARTLEEVVKDPTDALGFLIVGKKT